MQEVFGMSFGFALVIGFICVLVVFVFWFLIVLDIENQKQHKIFSTDKVKARQPEKPKDSGLPFK